MSSTEQNPHAEKPKYVSRSFVVSTAFIMLLTAIFSSGCSKAKSDSIRLSNQGMKALSSGNKRLAHARFADAIDIYPENANAHYGLGLALIDFGRLNKAAHHLTEATRLKPELVEGYYQQGWISFEQEKFSIAETALRRVLERDAGHGPAHYLLGRIYEKNNALKKANDAYRKAVQLNPGNSDIFLVLARLYLRVAAEKEAVAVLDEGIRLNSELLSRPNAGMALLYNERGIIQMQQGQYKEAVNAFRQAIKWDADRVEVAFNIACAYSNYGDIEMAFKYFNQYVDIGPADDETVKLARSVARHLYERIQAKSDDS